MISSYPAESFPRRLNLAKGQTHPPWLYLTDVHTAVDQQLKEQVERARCWVVVHLGAEFETAVPRYLAFCPCAEAFHREADDGLSRKQLSKNAKIGQVQGARDGVV